MIVRLLVFIVLILALGYGFSWLADRPGDLSLMWGGELYQTKLIVAASLLIAIVAAVMIVWSLLRMIWTSPHAVSRYFRARKRDRGYQALSTGLIAAGAGNALLARKMAARSRGLIRADQEPLISLLEAQAALIEGNHDEARAKFELMAKDPETRELGLRGLYLEAKRLGADEAARQYAEQAADKAPYLPWAAQATLEYRSRAGRWDDAIRLLDQQKVARVIGKDEANRLRAVLLTARATDRLDANPTGARDDALAALKLSDNLVPAALIAAKALFREDKIRKAAAVLEDAWKVSPHPEIGRAYVRARSGDSVLDRLKRAEKLEALRPNNVEALLITAQAALDAGNFAVARSKAEAAARMQPREGAFMLLADIEDAETRDQGRTRHWLAQALRAPRDPAWMADGFVSDKWLPVSPISGKLDAFEWRSPFSQLEGPVEEGTVASFETALRNLPPLADLRPAAAPVSGQPVQEPPAVAKPLPSGPLPANSPPAKPMPARTQPSTALVTVTKPESPKKPEPRPFFGGAPDDPGVRTTKADLEPKTRLKLF
ncbi:MULTISPECIES: heme biosynthesis protein HemY [Rhizobium]|uniref:Heme biosynthesis protein HemY n=1 Tax=Rhizobium rhododendri TaxID=2506430 RepID=A0ABY8IGG7_9HYPH|nr:MULTISPECIES: heme biosynthesis protein HemY [Rhizobium]MBZ5760829.1 heme biosynthesis protein HemY [Rhizobium sp. VS19-DR96]MBZ5765387.1 heme biosynthesis protein HemY [Rhizobium sp. VS19-DR129.2]MBZ5774650.1 heme biosynthesis protein HemY [Rhizobium sp. VS19-DRK62.2]MBZ5784664.1 heme biosynthesis protein HemY [Rhizobium sp. VS19-DR121]MBZ5801276.1 heme biosynthesis protein HemY [Rhizobium sp. VS19-DR181]